MKTSEFRYLLFLFIGFILHCNAQNFTGKVVDENGKPVSGASVYFDATNIGVVTNQSGNFSIEIPKLENALLVINFLGYETAYVNSLIKANQTYILKTKNDELEEILLSDSGFTRAELLVVFRKEFLGNNRISKKCKILNENAIRIKFDVKTNTVSAFSNEDLLVLNPELNYQIKFNLIDFEAKFNYKDLSNQYLKQSYFYGTSFFKDINEINEKHLKKRKKAYLGSIQHFFKALYISELEKNGFIVAKNSFRVSPESIFKLEKKDQIYTLKLGFSDAKKNSNLYEQIGKKVPYFYNVTVLHKKDQTDIKFTKNSINFDQYGNYSPLENVLLTGEMAKGKLGGMLPLNYSY